MHKFLNPFVHFSDKQLQIASIFITIFGILMAINFNTRFESVIDIDFVEHVSLTNCIIDLSINTIVFVTIFYFLGLWINKKVRLQDIMLVFLIARFPMYLLSLANINNYMYNLSNQLLLKLNTQIISNHKISNLINNDFITIILFSILSLVLLIYYIILLYNGFKNATNLKTNNQKLYFALCLIIVEMLSTLLIYSLS